MAGHVEQAAGARFAEDFRTGKRYAKTPELVKRWIDERPLAEPTSRTVVGLADIAARKYVRKALGADVLTFAMPWSLSPEMEDNMKRSFPDRPTWTSLQSPAQ